MIRIEKASQPPPTLRESASIATSQLCELVAAGGQRKFDQRIYGAPDVKQSLSSCQHDKCCFCESKLSHAQFGDVEHFRPKRIYYWLAYEWRNLYLSCGVCNRRHKRDQFDLEGGELPPASHLNADRVANERPLFVDPGADDPREHIEFRREYAAPSHASARGSATIAALALNRSALVEQRREHRAKIWGCLVALRQKLSSSAEDAESLELVHGLMRSASPNGEYAAMVRAQLEVAIPWCDFTRAGPAEAVLQLLLEGVRRGEAIQVSWP